ncbi:hypothetical protein [Arthrobacter sp. H14-L1]|uniref:hypothetical protein n=1 Tax=Arthrobacter sp. H14-L1 TaxID=2996697 RepID=UPI0022716286|nr:hypothetical protein [Arthrobacter sp. H14-L1]
MRLVLRAGSHREVADGTLEVAASPDTPRRERWQWDIRVFEAATAPNGSQGQGVPVRANLGRGDGSASRIEVRADAELVRPEIQIRSVGTGFDVERELQEVVAVIVGSGSTLAEGRHRLRELDALILEGDDPYFLRIEPGSNIDATVAVIRLKGTGSIGWVP